MGCPYKAIADDTRRKILEFLSEGETAAGEIASKFEISKPAISNHLKILKEADIVSERKVKQNRLYSLNNVEIDGMKYFLDSLKVKENNALRAQ
ncbi:MAG: metalloregulator ArsR/SmtB family transcription factor [Candidatus Dadabacteria bacterium]|jgi:DNA-binding transcriptional ArsR family regulator|nr:metalloregulator ArsR/SmtB family transcription factor [Candidatus Dadabacteria bacterium]MCZ6527477.1 metalloregulator ArsR/SmtB family transcription factor [Candidatus Dadabacteria bacterium]MCZ6554848.1 metalloregulator ArsR/SmtB family transcription factor [Candidatus Dadabacteria bacterium]MCZ6865405.1 metalloregulator ArsR/SmtB family transcription factor [Candidatus Dadabacteria bacterium]